MDADAVDIQANAKFRDESIKEFMHETKVLQKLAGAPNVNQIFDVMEVEAQLWIISEYVPGGSVKTLVCLGPSIIFSGLSLQRCPGIEIQVTC